MTENPDYQALAKRYLDLWQDQVAKLAKDPGALSGAAEAWSQMAASMMQNAATVAKTAHDPHAAASSSSRSQTSAAAHGDGGVDPAKLLGRIAELERRVAALEAAAAGAVRKPAAAKRTAKPKS